jgi:hypothetical protein
LLRFVRDLGNEMRRVFVITGEETDELSRLWLRTVWRHHQLTFEPRILPWVKFREETAHLLQRASQDGLDADDEFAAVMYNEFALFCRYRPENGPEMFRSTDTSIVKTAACCHAKLWEAARPLATWSLEHGFPASFDELEQETQDLVLDDIKAVRATME